MFKAERMTYTEKGDEVILVMSRTDYNILLMMLGCATAVPRGQGDYPTFCMFLDLVNRMNAGNPRFTPYDIPSEFGIQGAPS